MGGWLNPSILFIMIRHLITATLVATAPLNTTANASRSLYLNNYTPEEFTSGQYTEGIRYLCKPQQNINDIGLLEISVNSLVQQYYNNNTKVITNEFVFVMKVENDNDSTDTDSCNVNITRQLYLQYNENLVISANYEVFVINGNYDYSQWEYDPEEYLDDFATATSINNINADLIHTVIDDIGLVNPNDPLFKSNQTYSGQQAINKWKQNETQEYTSVLQAGKYDYYLMQGYISYDGTDQIKSYDTGMRTVNPITFNYTWTVPPQTGEVVDIPGIMFTMLGMPFAFISQAFDLTIFPGTIYQVNLTHIFMAIIVAGILIFVLKKVIK